MPTLRVRSSAPRRALRLVAALALLAAPLAMAVGCTSSATGIDSCRTIEHARCARAPSCDPNFIGGQDAVASCNRYYDVACARGLPSGASAPTEAELEACVAAINAQCSAALDPTSVAACSFLVGTTDAAADAATDTGDASSDGASEAAPDATSVDAASDATSVDAASDATSVDAASDATSDATSVDSATDAGADSGASTEVGSDGGADVLDETG
jgi:hypothetical protein